MPHPGDHRRLCSFFNWNPLRPGYGSAADGRRMFGDLLRKAGGEFLMTGMKVKKLQHSIGKVFDVFRLDCVATFRVGLRTSWHKPRSIAPPLGLCEFAQLFQRERKFLLKTFAALVSLAPTSDHPLL